MYIRLRFTFQSFSASFSTRIATCRFGSQHQIVRKCEKFFFNPNTRRVSGKRWLILSLNCLPSVSLPFVRFAYARSKLRDPDRVSEGSLHRDSKRNGVSNGREEFPWKQFWEFLKPYWPILLAAVITAILTAIVNIQIPLQIGVLVNVAVGLSRNTTTLSALHRPALKLIVTYAIQSVLTAIYISLISIVGESLARDLRISLFHSLIYREISFFDHQRTGELVARLSGDVQEFKSCFKQTVAQGLKSITQSIGCTISLYLISPKMTLITMSVLPSLVVFGAILGSFLRVLSRQAQRQLAVATAVADEALSNIRTVKAFAMEEAEENMYGREVERSRKLSEMLGIGVGLFQGVTNFALNAIVLTVIYGGSQLIISGEMTPGALMSFLVTTQVIQKSLAQLSMLFGQVIRGMSAGARVFEYINPKTVLPPSGTDIIPYHSLTGEVKFENVSFSYPTRPDFRVLKDFSLTIPAGKVVALCGSSGSGKSTIAALLERFYDVTDGRLTIDGKDIRELDTQWLRGRAIGFISQEPILFHTTIKENIRYGKPGASDEEIFDAAKMANADAFIRSFPHTYDTVVGERGVTLSGGQKQRIAIARALLKNPTILILDEATSALDAESERLVQEALEKVQKGRTVLVIAHRLSTVQRADAIAVIANKKIAEMGTHKELMKQKGLYWQLVQHQQDPDSPSM